MFARLLCIQDRKLEKFLHECLFRRQIPKKAFFEALRHEGKIPAKMDMQTFLEGLHNGRGNAVSLVKLAAEAFPDVGEEEALNYVSILLAIAPLAKNEKGAVLFPARMHMLFKGIKGVYACANENCPHSHTNGTLTLGEIFWADGHLTCPHCNSVVYELYNDRRCGALFYKGYVLGNALETHQRTYL